MNSLKSPSKTTAGTSSAVAVMSAHILLRPKLQDLLRPKFQELSLKRNDVFIRILCLVLMVAALTFASFSTRCCNEKTIQLSPERALIAIALDSSLHGLDVEPKRKALYPLHPSAQNRQFRATAQPGCVLSGDATMAPSSTVAGSFWSL
jgi:hypothetical protein